MTKDTKLSVLEQYEQRQIELAKLELIRKGLCDDEIQAQRNLEMDIEEREQLSTGNKKAPNILRQFFQ